MSAEIKELEKPAKPLREPPSRRRKTGTGEVRAPAKRKPDVARLLWAKGQAALRSARLLADAGDWDGAINRTYYAAFSAARAVLAQIRTSLAQSKRHSTIIRRLRKHVLQDPAIDPVLKGSFFGRLSHARWVADYDHNGGEEAVARAVLAEAERFLSGLARLREAKA